MSLPCTEHMSVSHLKLFHISFYFLLPLWLCPPSLPLCSPSSPMWWCPSCLSMQWTSLTRCRDTCWTWMTRQALWLPWQQPCWLAVSPRLVLHWQVPCSSEGTVGLPIIYELTFLNTFISMLLHNLLTSSHYLHYVLRSAPEFTSINPHGPHTSTEDFPVWYLCAFKANRGGYISKADRKKLVMSFENSLYYAEARDVSFTSSLESASLFSSLCSNGPSEYKRGYGWDVAWMGSSLLIRVFFSWADGEKQK